MDPKIIGYTRGGVAIPEIRGAADILIDNQSAPSTPAAGKSVLWVDSTTKRLVQTDDSGTVHAGAMSTNHATSQQTGFASDTYVTGSGILIPSFGMQVGQLYCWEIGIEKSAAGTALLAVTIRTGSNQSTADTSRCALAQTVAQAATASANVLFVRAFVRTVSASGVLIGSMGSTGTQMGDGDRIVSSTFDNTAMGGLYVDLSLNGGASASYTIDYVKAWLIA
jgi:hypothetical protein